jgi:hypothetical protein
MGMYHTNVSMKHHIYPWLPVAQNAPLSGCHEVWGTRLAPPFFQEDLWAGRWQIPFDMQWYMHIIHNICLYLSMYLFTCLFRYIYIYIAYIRTYNCVRVYHNTYIYIYNIDVYIHKPLGLLFHHGLVSSSYAPPISTSFLRSEVQWLQKRWFQDVVIAAF